MTSTIAVKDFRKLWYGGFCDVSKRTDEGNESCKMLTKFLLALAKIESNYGKELKGLEASFNLSQTDIGSSFHVGCNALLASLAVIGKRHGDMAEDILAEAESTEVIYTYEIPYFSSCKYNT